MVRICKWCGGPIPDSRATQARSCSNTCKNRSNVKAWKQANPERVRANGRRYAKRRWASRPEECRRNQTLYRHQRAYGHTLYVDDPMSNPYDRFRAARVLGYRSGLEVKVTNELKAKGIPFEYESLRMPFTQPAKKRTYTPDFCLPSGIIVETKGAFPTQERQKMLHARESNPDVDVRLVFSRASSRISKKSKTTYAMWCESNGFLYADKSIPDSWLEEGTNHASLAAIAKLRKESK